MSGKARSHLLYHKMATKLQYISANFNYNTSNSGKFSSFFFNGQMDDLGTGTYTGHYKLLHPPVQCIH